MAQATKRHRQSREWFATAWLGLPSLLFSLDSMLWSRTGDVSKWGMWVTAHIGKHAGYKHFYFMCQRVVLLMWYFSKKHAITYLQIVGLTVSNTKPVNLFKILHGEGFSSWQTKPPVLFPQSFFKYRIIVTLTACYIPLKLVLYVIEDTPVLKSNLTFKNTWTLPFL